MSPRPLDDPCALCGDAEVPCRLCVAEMDMSHERALEAEGDRLALAFAELGDIPEVPCEPGLGLGR